MSESGDSSLWRGALEWIGTVDVQIDTEMVVPFFIARFVGCSPVSVMKGVEKAMMSSSVACGAGEGGLTMRSVTVTDVCRYRTSCTMASR